MKEYEPILSGIPGLDEALDSVRLGDNVVWQVTALSEFSCFVGPFVRQAKKDGRRVIYIRFASHEPLLSEEDGVSVENVELSFQYETFTMEIYRIIQREGSGAMFVFDCLSELQLAWATDLMMGNFFCVTCPFLFQSNTVAYFPIIRGRHSNSAITKIRDTAQLMFDVFSQDGKLYVQLLKAWNRYTPNMFMPHAFLPDKGEYYPIKSGVEAGRYYQLLGQHSSLEAELQNDSWDRFFNTARAEYQAGTLSEDRLEFMCDNMMTRDPKLRELVLKYYTAEDYFFVRSRMIGTGMIGGKACGMLLARRIVEAELPEYRKNFEPHDSFFIGSDVFYTFLVDNDCWGLRIRSVWPEEYSTVAPEMQRKISAGRFSSGITKRFKKIVDYFGSSPIIVRSSSIQEDGFGNAFAGKYESVFCANTGSAEERLEKFEAAVKQVYVSALDRSALEYRRDRGLLKQEEQMALLVQRVSGSYFGPFYMPDAAGVGYSYSAFRFMSDMDPSAGMLRMVAGLGTRAVDRTPGDYPALISLDRPEALARPSPTERHRYSQSKLDVLDVEQGLFREVELRRVMEYFPASHKRMLLEHDTDAETALREMDIREDVMFLSCRGLALHRGFTEMMRLMLHTLERSYGKPVDIEYTVNFDDGGEYLVNLLQCRPLQVCSMERNVSIPKVAEDRQIIHIRDACMGNPRDIPVRAVVKVDPYEYYTMPYNQKPAVAAIIGRLNDCFKARGIKMVLLVPGRIGTSSPELGVPVSFADINSCEAIFEIGYSKAGYMPELSFGSHIFQDLVECDIFYGAVLEGEQRLSYRPELLDLRPNQFLTLCPDSPEMERFFHVAIFDDGAARLCYNINKEEALLYLC